MATKEIWINLPVKDVKRARAFFSAIGFRLNPTHGNTETSAAFLVGSKNIALMLFEDTVFKGFIQGDISDPAKGSEMLISFDAESRAEVDELSEKVQKAGGHLYSKPAEHQGWMYGCAFSDPDGHKWNVLYMDLSKMK